MTNGYDQGDKPKQVPTMALVDFEQEVKRILARDQIRIDAQKKEIEELDNIIGSKNAQIAALDTEISEEVARRRAEADVLVQEAKKYLATTKANDEAIASLLDETVAQAAQASIDKTKAAEIVRSLEMEQAVLRAKIRETTALQESLKEARLLADSKLLDLAKRESAANERDKQLDADATELSAQAAGIREARKAIDNAVAQLQASKDLLRKDQEDLVVRQNDLKITQAERAAFNVQLEALKQKEAGFIETDSRLTAIENRIKLDAQALREANADLERRRKNIESREAQLAKGA